MKHSYEKIEESEFDVEQMKKEYLRSRGWVSDASYPGSFILWRNDGRGYNGCSLDTAYDLESHSE